MSEHGAAEKEKSIEIALAVPEDAEGITQVQEETWLSTYPNEEAGITREDIQALQFAGPEYLQRWKVSLETPKGDRQTWVARERGAVVGYCVARKGEDVNRLQAIYVSPRCQGKGLGKKLMDAALLWLGEDKDVVLDVASYNTSSIGFYKRLGFKMTGKDGLHVVPGVFVYTPNRNVS